MLNDAKFTFKELEEALGSGQVGQAISADDAVRAIVNGLCQLRSELEEAGELIVKLERRVRLLEQSQSPRD